MKIFSVNKSIFDTFHELHLGVVICRNISNNSLETSEILLTESIELAKQQLFSIANLTDLEIIRDWRNAYKKFGEKKNRSSIESLLRRIYNNKNISSINPLVDIYNSISIKYQLPCGGEDLDNIPGNIELTISNGNENFISLGSTTTENPNPNEIIYKSDDLVICRCFNWREAEFSKLTHDTKNAFLCIECLNSDNLDTLKQSIEDLSTSITNLLGGSCETFIINKNNPMLQIK